ncbi:pathogenesis-related thaumatin-like protein, partial [Striga asiatica]
MNILSKTTSLFLLILLFQTTQSIIFNITNNCPYTIWPAAVPGGGRRLDPGHNWTISFLDGPRAAKIWARTNCTFDSSGRGRCLTGDCDGQLACGSYGAAPRTTAEYGLNSFGHIDYYDISVMNGFNVPVEFSPTTNGCTRPVRCPVDLTRDCLAQLRTPGGLRPCRQTWTINVPAGTSGVRIWARTGCSFDESGHGQCQTSDCNRQLQCQGYDASRNTLVEYALNQFNNLDFFDISLVDGFNIPMEFSPENSEGCTRGIECTTDINGQCPNDLQAPG